MACIWRAVTLNYAHSTIRCCQIVPRRHRYKKKWAVNLPSKTSTELALEHFDAFYRPMFGKQWPSIRVSLLSLPKYAALVNNAADSELAVQHLTQLGTVDLIQETVKTVHKTNPISSSSTSTDLSSNFEQNDIGGTEISKHKKTSEETGSCPAPENIQETSFDFPENEMAVRDHRNDNSSHYQIDGMKNLLTPDTVQKSADLEYFMPAEQVYSEREMLRQEEYSQSVYEERPVSVSVMPGQGLSLPTALTAMVFPAGNVSDFPRPATDQCNLLNYYLMDAASLLPVLALDIQGGDHVLDLCAAPGGKTLAMLQVILSQGGHLECNDVSRARVQRLKTVLRSYLSENLRHEYVTVGESNGCHFRNPVYNKVLVDVPCNSDRHVLVEEDNNLFKPGRINERLKMTTLQKDLLLAGIRSCKPGGSVVYSTCTLAAVQNDGVVQAAVEELWETSDIDVVVEDLSPLQAMFSSFFKFHTSTRLGQLVLPSLLNNFGPMYFCKLRRVQ